MNIPTYDNAYSFDNVYGHTVELLRKHSPVSNSVDAVHIDLGCGYGRMAEVISFELKRTYVGFDLDLNSVESLKNRGFEAYPIDFNVQKSELIKNIENKLNGRNIISITLIDVLEHLSRVSETLNMIRELAHKYNAILILSVPNIAHRDVGFKLAFGRYDITSAGLLDHTHMGAYTAIGLKKTLSQHGLHIIENNNVNLEHSDQAFPLLHPAIADNSLLSIHLRGLRENIDPNSTVNQFVVACLSGPIESDIHKANEQILKSQKIPFLSIITRTQGTRPSCLTEVLLSLAAQSCSNFEIIIVGHKLTLESQLSVERIIASTNTTLRDKINFLKLDRGNRTAPLNFGFEAARGDYVVILDDDDVPMAHWVEVFFDLSQKAPGKIVRSVAINQNFDQIKTTHSTPTVRAISGFRKDYPSSFNTLQQLRDNYTPGLAIAFPRTVFSEMGLRFDESLETAEDWDFMMRAVFICGVESSPEITCIYRGWASGHSSKTEHTPDEWKENHQKIFAKMDRFPILLPAGSARELRDLLDKVDEISRENSVLKNLNEAMRSNNRLTQEILSSNSWKITAPLRAIKKLFSRLKI